MHLSLHLNDDLHHVKWHRMCRIHLQNGWRGERRERGREEGRGRGGGGKGREGKGRGGEGRGGGGEAMELLPAAVAGTGVPQSEVAGSTVQPVRERRNVWKGYGEREGRWEGSRELGCCAFVRIKVSEWKGRTVHVSYLGHRLIATRGEQVEQTLLHGEILTNVSYLGHRLIATRGEQVEQTLLHGEILTNISYLGHRLIGAS